MKLYNTLSKHIEDFKPQNGNDVRIYSCGPTVYDHIHIGNLTSFIYADTLHRALKATGYNVIHVMNITDIDDKTIKRSKETYPDLDPKDALNKLTEEYTAKFMDDMKAIGNEVTSVKFVKATDNIPAMQTLINELYEMGFAYIAEDGVYFSIEKYRKSGKKYGQLVDITESNTSEARIQNDEYDKESAHDFALWKKQKAGEPAWDFKLDGKDISGRPGWHIECSAMSVGELGQPFDIHTGGVDLMFPHHENEIAQSTAVGDTDALAKVFFHNEHMHIEGKKMSKSLNNFITLEDIKQKGFNPLAFRLMVLQSHYQSQSNFTWENLEAAQNKLKDFYKISELTLQVSNEATIQLPEYSKSLNSVLSDNLNTPQLLSNIYATMHIIESHQDTVERKDLNNFMQTCRDLLGLDIQPQELENELMLLIDEREDARKNRDWSKSDQLRKKLEGKGIGVNDTPSGPIWYRI